MTIPKFNELFGDVLRYLSDGNQRHRKELISGVAQNLDLTDSERAETHSSGRNLVRGRVSWASIYLVQAGALSRPQRGFLQITELGKEMLSTSNGNITLAMLRETEGMKAWSERSIVNRINRDQSWLSDDEGFDVQHDPQESIESSVQLLNSALAGELLQRIRDERPDLLEKLVLRLLHQMGYGASLSDLEHLGGPGDEGVDGVIHQDRLGLEKIYIQAKRYRETGPIGRPSVQSFVGALTGKKASRGVFITTSKFSKDALDYVNNLTGVTVVLIDGEKLVNFMMNHRVGVTTQQTFEILTVDENFFGEGALD
jgi:restriction system protein